MSPKESLIAELRKLRATVYRLLPHIKRHVEIWAELDNELQGNQL